MCLEHITQKISAEAQAADRRLIFGGYKIFRKDSSYNIFSFLHKSKKMAIGKWLNERDFRPSKMKDSDTVGTWGRQYLNGWHVFTDEREANRILRASKDKNVVLRLVKYKGVHTLGTEKGNIHIAVCKHLYVMPLAKTTPKGTLKKAVKGTLKKGGRGGRRN